MKNASNFQDGPEGNPDTPENAPPESGTHDRDSSASTPPANAPNAPSAGHGDDCAHCKTGPTSNITDIQPKPLACKGTNLKRLNDQVLKTAETCRGALSDAAIMRVKRLAEPALEASDCVKVIGDLQSLQFRQQSILGQNNPVIAYTDMLLGLCHQRTRNFDPAVKSLRSAVVRFQQSDVVDEELFIECLCMMASIYRESNKFDAARTTIKQAYRIIPDTDSPMHLQARVLEELAAVLIAEHQYKAAVTAYERLISMHQQIGDHQSNDLINAWSGLGLCHFTLHNLDGAENALVRAIEIYFDTDKDDRYLMVHLMESLAGVLRHKGQFLQADMMTERAHELLGRVDQVRGHALYGNTLHEAELAEQRGDLDKAKELYRQALCAIEAQRERRVADRIPILARMYLMTTRKQIIQRTSLLADMEDAIRDVSCGYPGEITESLRRLSMIFRLLGRPSAAKDLLVLSEELKREMAALSSTEGLRIDQNP